MAFPRVPKGQAIVGYYGIERAGRLMSKRRPVQFQVAVNGATAYDDETQNDNEMRPFTIPLDDVSGDTADIEFSVRADNVSRRFFCFNAQVVDFK